MGPDAVDQLIIVGSGETAQIAYEYFTHDSPYEVVAFSVEKPFLQKNNLNGLPVVPFEEVENHFDPDIYAAHVAVSYTQLNRVRTRLYRQAKKKGYTLASYVSSHAFLWRTAEIGENCFVFEHNVIQHGVTIGNNVILWSGNHIGHQTIIKDNCYIASHAVISGYCQIDENCFLGVNCCLNDKIQIAKDCVIGSGAVIVRDTEAGKVYAGNPAKQLKKSSYESFQVKSNYNEMD